MSPSFRERLLAACEADSITRGRTLVFGEGNAVKPPVLLIGEAPGGQEERLGHPFVGKAGENLNHFLEVLGLRREDIYITNVVKVRPCRVSAKGTVANRPPNGDELRLFTPFLYEELSLVQPRLTVTLGNTALHALLGPEATIGQCHGVLRRAVLPGGAAYDLFPLYHPASIIYNRALQSVYEADLAALKAVLQRFC